jgi:trehalose 6-phosphate phosphatase
LTSFHALAARVAAPPGRILVITDFDGTISEIDPDPMAARIDPLARRALRRIGRIAEARPDRLALAILTGRAVSDVAGRARVGGVRYLGNFGLDVGRLPRRANVRAFVERTAESSPDSPAAVLGRKLVAALGDPDWLFVEVKGGSVAFHYRRAPDPERAGQQIGRAVDELLAADGLGLERFDGRLIVELRPIGAGGKGAAVGRLLAELGPRSVLALGDDRSDAEGFVLLAQERAAGRLAALNVGIHDRTATPPELIAAADVMLAAPRDAARLLSALATELERG